MMLQFLVLLLVSLTISSLSVALVYPLLNPTRNLWFLFIILPLFPLIPSLIFSRPLLFLILLSCPLLKILSHTTIALSLKCSILLALSRLDVFLLLVLPELRIVESACIRKLVFQLISHFLLNRFPYIQLC